MADINGVLERLVKYKILVVEGPGKDAFCAVGLAMGPKKCIKFISTVSLCSSLLARMAKGQLISNCPFGVIILTKIPPNIFKVFLP